MTNTISLLTLSLFATTACIDQGLPEDGVDDSFVTDGKADGGLSAAETAGVLQAANQATRTELDIDAGISSRTVTNIIAKRSYSTLAQLDAVPYVGPAALDQLLAYAYTRGWVVEPTIFPTCLGAPKFPTTGAVPFRTVTRSAYKRTCDGFGVCTDWAKSGDDIALTFDFPSEIMPHLVRLQELDRGYTPELAGRYEIWEAFSTTMNSYSSVGAYVALDRTTGIAKGYMDSGERSKLCNSYGCAPWAYHTPAPQRQVTLHLGSTCMTITDDDPATNYGAQTKAVIKLAW